MSADIINGKSLITQFTKSNQFVINPDLGGLFVIELRKRDGLMPLKWYVHVC